MFTLNLKLTIEAVHKFKSRDLLSFEEERYNKFKNVDEVVIEGYCNFCKRFSVGYIYICEYLDIYVKSNVLKTHAYDQMCVRCNQGYLDFHTIV